MLLFMTQTPLSFLDILGANKIGMKAIYFNFHKTNEENRENVIIIENLEEILKILP